MSFTKKYISTEKNETCCQRQSIPILTWNKLQLSARENICFRMIFLNAEVTFKAECPQIHDRVLKHVEYSSTSKKRNVIARS